MFCDFLKTVELDGKPYTIALEHEGDGCLITVNNKILFHDRWVLDHLSFYEVTIGTHVVTLFRTADQKNKECYELFVDGISLSTGNSIDKEKEEAHEKTKGGFWCYIKKNYKSIFKKQYRWFFAFLFGGTAAMLWISWNRKMWMLLMGIPLLFLFIPLFVLVEYYETKNIVKKWEQRYRVRARYEDL